MSLRKRKSYHHIIIPPMPPEVKYHGLITRSAGDQQLVDHLKHILIPLYPHNKDTIIASIETKPYVVFKLLIKGEI